MRAALLSVVAMLALVAVGRAGTASGGQSTAGAAGGPSWSSPVRLGVGSDPHVALDPAGDAVVAWQGPTGVAEVASRRAGSDRWSSPGTLADRGTSPLVALDSAGNA